MQFRCVRAWEQTLNFPLYNVTYGQPLTQDAIARLPAKSYRYSR